MAPATKERETSGGREDWRNGRDRKSEGKVGGTDGQHRRNGGMNAGRLGGADGGTEECDYPSP